MRCPPAKQSSRARLRPGSTIVDWTTCGTCRWMIDARGCLTIAPMEGADSGNLSYWKDTPWYDYRDSITSAKIKDGVVAATTFRMFRGCSRLISVDLSGLDTSKGPKWAERTPGRAACSPAAPDSPTSTCRASTRPMSRAWAACSTSPPINP
ncbi:hypothetical protein F8C90_10665 [Ellagibacter isourolithinifaciens]|uniref:Uncharacterized protein n=1 Tax=Ellagibacter isourolithinifaciens TaxID=2137581 RepID=A0A6N6NPG4_9ACTN|nr:hypothetical protein F8C90_10665 [Ellagibacter isourolithinifaciens]